METPRASTRPTAMRLAVVAALILVAGLVMPLARAAEPVVRAVLFFSPTCPHCHTVIDEVLPPLFFEHGGPAEMLYDQSLPPEATAFYLITNGRLEVLVADVSVQDGSRLFYAATEAFGIGSQGVPRLVVGDEVMIGSVEIPDRLPGIIAATLDGGGVIDWPEIPGIEAAVAATGAASATTTTTVTTTTTPVATTAGGPADTTEASAPSATTAPDTTVPATTIPEPSGDDEGGVSLPGASDPSMWDRFRQDVTGNSVSVVVLVGMAAALVAAALRLRRPARSETTPSWVIPLLAATGLVVASYLAFVEVGDTEAVCGPVGDCNAVQASEYARLFGVIPIGIIGVAGYLVVIGAWAAGRLAQAPIANWAVVALGAGAVAGTLLSMYLTFLEPFVIGATCMWCIASAVVITLVMWLSVHPAASAYQRLRAAG